MALNPRQKIIKQDAFKKKTTAQRVLEAEQKRKGIVPDQAPTIDPNAPRLGDDRKKGVFTDSAGQTVNSAGRPVEASGKPIADPTAEEPLATYGEIGEANIQAEYDANQATELDLTGATSGYSSMDEYFKDLFASQKENTQLSREQLELQRQQGVETTTDQKNAIMGGVETAQGQLTGSREGVTSGSNQTTLGRYQTVTGQQIQRLQQAQDLSAKAIEQAKVNLDRAERSGNTQLAEQYRSQLLSAKSQAQQTETDLRNVLSEQLKTESAVQAENIATFQGLIDEGQELSVETISGFAKKLGIDFDTAYGYYAGVQNIRDDKTLSLEEKEVEIAQAKQDLDDQIRGVTTESAKKIDYLDKQTQQWASMGYSPTEIQEMRSNMRTMLGIEDQSDPAYLADLAYKQAQTTYSQSNTAVNYQDLLTKQLEYAQSMGYTGEAYIPSSTRGGLYNVTTATSEDGSTSVQITNKEGKPLSVGDYGGQCGKFVNDLFGTDMFGDDYINDKLSKVDFSVTVPAPGMAITIPMKGPYAKNGHVVYVTGVDAVNQQVNYIDSNSHNDETVDVGSMTFQELGQLISTKTGGLVVNPNSRVEGGGAVSNTFTPTDVSMINNFLENGKVPSIYEGKESELIAKSNQLSTLATDPSTPLSQALSYTTGKKALTDTAVQSIQKNDLTADQISTLATSFEDLDEKDFGPLLGIISSNNPYNQKAQEIKAQLQSIVPNLARGVYGEVGVLTDADIANYMKTLPNLTSTEGLRDAVLEMTQRTIGRSLESKLRAYAGTYDISGYQYIIDKYNLDQPEPEDDTWSMFTPVEEELDSIL